MLKRPITVGLLALASLPAQADIFKCTDAAGHVTYSNVASKGCAKMNLDPVSTIPAAKPAPKTPTPAGFPRVEENAQKARDNDRRKILEQELAAEEKNLDEAKKKLAEGEIALPQERMQGGGINQAKVQERTQPLRDQVQLHERNLEAIRKELQNLR
jgi:hypothetical protein